jgi:hypothetical protein
MNTDKIKDLFKQFSPAVTNNATFNSTANPASNKTITEAYAGSALKDLNMLQIPLNLMAQTGLTPLEITAYDFSIEPAVVLDTILQHSPFKYSISPIAVAFDANGNTTFASNTYTSVSYVVTAVSSAPSLIGVLIYARVNDILVGQRDITIAKAAADISLKYRLLNDSGALFVWNCAKNQKKAITAPLSDVATVLTATSSVTTTATSDFLYFAPADSNPWTIAGANVQVEVYPVVGRIEVYNALVEGLFTRDLSEFSQMVVDQIAGVTK